MKIRKLHSALHRDIGYFLSGLIFVYCLSGIALNHLNDWNPDFVIQKRTITLPRAYAKSEINDERIAEFSALVGESKPKGHDFPTDDRLKLYYDNASLLVDLSGRTGEYESVQRRPLFYHMNVLHRNSLKGWKWASDIFAVMLVFITVSGWFMLKGKYGVLGRGKWLIVGGMLPPLIALILFDLLQK